VNLTGYLYLALIALVLALGGWGGCERKRATDALDALRSLQTSVALDRALSEAEARATEARHRAALEAVAVRYTEELHDAQARADAVVADLRAGNLRLREHWRGCENAAARVPAATAAGTGADDGAELREAGARDLVRLGAACDAWIRGLQRVIETN